MGNSLSLFIYLLIYYFLRQGLTYFVAQSDFKSVVLLLGLLSAGIISEAYCVWLVSIFSYHFPFQASEYTAETL